MTQFLLSIYKSVATHLLLTISESMVVGCAEESMHFVKPQSKFSHRATHVRKN
jgi:hypothetical protein